MKTFLLSVGLCEFFIWGTVLLAGAPVAVGVFLGLFCLMFGGLLYHLGK